MGFLRRDLKVSLTEDTQIQSFTGLWCVFLKVRVTFYCHTFYSCLSVWFLYRVVEVFSRRLQGMSTFAIPII